MHVPGLALNCGSEMSASAKLDQKGCMAAAQEKLVQWCRLEAVGKTAGSGLAGEDVLEMEPGSDLSDGAHDAGTAFLSGRPYTWKTVPLPRKT